jgi:hypothetical protein
MSNKDKEWFDQHMYFVGTSISRCVPDILDGKLDTEQVLGMYASTAFTNYEEMCDLAVQYQRDYAPGHSAQRFADVMFELMSNGTVFFQRRLSPCFTGIPERSGKVLPSTSGESQFIAQPWTPVDLEVFHNQLIGLSPRGLKVAAVQYKLCDTQQSSA